VGVGAERGMRYRISLNNSQVLLDGVADAWVHVQISESHILSASLTIKCCCVVLQMSGCRCGEVSEISYQPP